MSTIRRYILTILGVLAAVALGIVGVLTGLKRSREQKRAGELAEDLAKQNAERARDQADKAAQAVGAEADKAVAAKDAEAQKEASNAADTGSLAEYLNRR